MASLPQSILVTVERFAESMNLVAQPSRDGSYTFEFETSGRLTFTPNPDRNGHAPMMSLSRPMAGLAHQTMPILLARAGYDAATDRMIHVGATRDQRAVAWTTLGDERFELSDLEAAWAVLRGTVSVG
ncbi:type III secretion system chaperone family protein [Rhizobium alvei]|uniref:Uncharacterized protein n=1 Tax=Rhizobium alvei TaxID=1132659 RepID=A0ABT8YSH0_9HYPH|nr:hypothetical protein [Rhizobium alvei]MDO6966450.1 hypothetical protein [Rhizobium alvei]